MQSLPFSRTTRGTILHSTDLFEHRNSTSNLSQVFVEPSLTQVGSHSAAHTSTAPTQGNSNTIPTHGASISSPDHSTQHKPFSPLSSAAAALQQSDSLASLVDLESYLQIGANARSDQPRVQPISPREPTYATLDLAGPKVFVS
jgi:hypothetical protein